jgi:hypothetical protein
MTKLTREQKTQALNNALRNFNFDMKYFIHADNRKHIFCIVSINKLGGRDIHSNLFTYEEMNGYIMGYNDGIHTVKQFLTINT